MLYKYAYQAIQTYHIWILYFQACVSIRNLLENLITEDIANKRSEVLELQE